MRFNNKSIISTLLALSLVLPTMAQAASLTTDQINSIVSLLQSFGADTKTVTNVQLVLNGQRPQDDHGSGAGMSSSTWAGATSTPRDMSPGQMGKMVCLRLVRDLRVGAQGDDVRKLQELLAQDPSVGFTASSTGFFGPMTAKALMRFQMNNGIASSTDGRVGTLTRGFFQRACGKGLEMMHGNPGMGSTTPHQVY